MTTDTKETLTFAICLCLLLLFDAPRFDGSLPERVRPELHGLGGFVPIVLRRTVE